MSRATSGSAIFDDNSAIRFSRPEISASIISASRGFLTTLIRLDPSAEADGLKFFLALRVRAAAAPDVAGCLGDCALSDGRASDSATAGGSDCAAFQS